MEKTTTTKQNKQILYCRFPAPSRSLDAVVSPLSSFKVLAIFPSNVFLVAFLIPLVWILKAIKLQLSPYESISPVHNNQLVTKSLH